MLLYKKQNGLGDATEELSQPRKHSLLLINTTLLWEHTHHIIIVRIYIINTNSTNKHDTRGCNFQHCKSLQVCLSVIVTCHMCLPWLEYPSAAASSSFDSPPLQWIH